jgi:16S rRNA (cytosine967-C5)-methyltransferase
MSQPIKRTPTGFSKGRAREVALRTLQAIEEEDAFLQPALERYGSRARLDTRDRSLALELVMGVERQRTRIDHTLERLIDRGLAKTTPALQRILRLAAYQILFLDRVPDHAVLNEAVEQARVTVSPGAARMVNGVLRGLLREGEELPEGDGVVDMGVRTSHPNWMIRRWMSTGGPRLALARGNANNRPSPLMIRVNQSELSRERLLAILTAEGATVRPARIAPDAIHLEKHGRPFESQSFQAGLWRAQDEASQLVVLLLDPKPGETVWDVCAAPGGKTRYIARRMGDEGRLLATDVNPDKIKRLVEEMDDVACAEAMVYDATAALDGAAPFDRVLIDAPCTALGIVRRHPEIKWRRSNRDPANRAELQGQIIRAASKGVKPGGVLVYSVCTDTREEGHEVVMGFLADHPEFSVEVPEGQAGVNWAPMINKHGFFESNPERFDMDSFFAARLRRSMAPALEPEAAEPEVAEAEVAEAPVAEAKSEPEA